ncbi:MAG: MerR family transcriptional regulator, partial [Candidatus Levybacteria bacterium]|nr:MerR family transcriptional regulator [Candidatus Levybacteria bacterium]
MTKKLPNFTDTAGRTLIPISEASDILGVSQQTLRRWDHDGKIFSIRADGKNRYFPKSEIERIKSAKKFTISQAAEFLGVSTTTLRRLDEKGIIVAKREAGDRVYDLSDLENFKLKSNKKELNETFSESRVSEAVEDEDIQIPSPRKVSGAILIATLICLVTFRFLPEFPIFMEEGSSQVLGAVTSTERTFQNLKNIFLAPFISKKVTPEAKNKNQSLVNIKNLN